MVDPDKFPRDDLVTGMAEATVQVAFVYKNSPTDRSFQRLPL
jgi:hypothetical protein